MNYFLDIIIPRKEIEIVKLNEKLFVWGEGVYSCNPPQYISDSDILFDLKYAVNNQESILEENVLLNFMNKLTELSQFYILMVREDSFLPVFL